MTVNGNHDFSVHQWVATGRLAMGQHQAKLDNSGPSPPPIFGYEPDFGAYPINNPPAEVLALQNKRNMGPPAPRLFGQKPAAEYNPACVIPYPGQPIPVNVSEILANAPPFPKDPATATKNDDSHKNLKDALLRPRMKVHPMKLPSQQQKDLEFDLAKSFCSQMVPADPDMLRKTAEMASNMSKLQSQNFSLDRILNKQKETVTPSDNIPSDPVLRSHLTSKRVQLPIIGTQYDTPADSLTAPPPPLPPRMNSLCPPPMSFNPFCLMPPAFLPGGVPFAFPPTMYLPNPFLANSQFSEIDRRSDHEVIILLANIIKRIPVLWAPKFDTREDLCKVEMAWEEVGKRIGCSTIWPLQRYKIVWLSTMQLFKKNINNPRWTYYRYLDYLLPSLKTKTKDTKANPRVPGMKSSQRSSALSEFEDDYIPPQKIRNVDKQL